MKSREELVASITDYFSSGGLFNPEMMDRGIVNDILFECREFLLSEDKNSEDKPINEKL